jgi:hypothetical protein
MASTRHHNNSTVQYESVYHGRSKGRSTARDGKRSKQAKQRLDALHPNLALIGCVTAIHVPVRSTLNTYGPVRRTL